MPPHPHKVLTIICARDMQHYGMVGFPVVEHEKVVNFIRIGYVI